MADRRIHLGVAGLGRAFTLMLPTLGADPRVQLVAAADPDGDHGGLPRHLAIAA